MSVNWQRTTRRLNSITGLLLLILVATFLVMNTFFYVNHYEPPSNGYKPILRISSSAINWTALDRDDASCLLNLTGFKFVINNLRCRKSAPNLVANEVFLVIFIHSAPNHFDKRLAIRRTWGNESNFADYKIRVVFTLGLVFNQSVQQLIREENANYHDVVQGNFVDSYRNLSYKHVMGLKWVTYYCQNARFVFKTDDDIFVDIFQLIYYLKGSHLDPNPPRNFMSCYVITNPYPKRNVKSKWHVTYEEYSGKYYPEYCSGWGILMSPDVVFNLYLQSRKVPFFWVDDVLVSGLLAKEIGIRHIDLTPRLAIGDEDITGWLKKKELSIPPLFGHPDSDTNTIYALWNKSIKYYKTKYSKL